MVIHGSALMVNLRRLHSRSKGRLARPILAEVAPLLPPDWQVYVQFDSWYASRQLIKDARRRGWQVICGLKSNRQLNGISLKTHAQALKHRWYTQVGVTTADGTSQTYYVRQLQGRLIQLPDEIRVFLFKRHPRKPSLADIACTDLACSAKVALQSYTWRWSCETVNFYLKTQLGLADFRVRSVATVGRYMVVVYLAWAYVEQRFARERSAQVATYGDIIRQHRDEHAIVWLRAAIYQAIETQDAEAVLQQFLRLPATAT